MPARTVSADRLEPITAQALKGGGECNGTTQAHSLSALGGGEGWGEVGDISIKSKYVLE